MKQQQALLPREAQNDLANVWNEPLGEWEFDEFDLMSKEDIKNIIISILGISYIKMNLISFSFENDGKSDICSYEFNPRFSFKEWIRKKEPLESKVIAWINEKVPLEFKIIELCIFASFKIAFVENGQELESTTTDKFFKTDGFDMDIYITQRSEEDSFGDTLYGHLTVRPNIFTDQVVAWKKGKAKQIIDKKRIVDISSVGAHNRAILHDLITRLCVLLQTPVKQSSSEYLQAGMELNGIAENARPYGLW